MRIIVVALALLVIIAACGGRVDKESRSFVQRDTTTQADAPEKKPAPASNFQIISAGEFGYNTHRVAGAALVINNGSKQLLLRNFQTEARPDLRVFVRYGNEEIDVGPLTQYTGNISFPLTQDTITQVTIRSGTALLATAELS